MDYNKHSPSFARYEQRTGLFEIFAFVDDGGAERCLYQSVGYAGRRNGKNQPAAECLRNIGPLPRGMYRVGLPEDHPRLGPVAYRLYPYEKNDMCGRSGFFIHGDSRRRPGEASQGCIVLGRPARDAILEYHCRYLEVVAGPDPKSGEAGDLNLTK